MPRQTAPLLALALLLVSAPAPLAAEVTFRCEANPGAEVFLAGEFNGWDPTAQPMGDPDGDGVFEATLELEDGRYPYKFVVDGNWQADPAATETVDDGFGGQNSVVVVGDAASTGAPPAASTPAAAGARYEVGFRYEGQPGQRVSVAGEFNDWSPEADPLADADGDGVYEATLALAPGEYAYKFVVDGEWLQDPAAQGTVDDGFGGQNSLLVVEASGEAVATPAPAVAAGERLVRFRLHAPGAGNVHLAGDFNQWSDSADPMVDTGDGHWELQLPLRTGRYQYKFVVDGNWQEDPTASAFEDDGFGGRNSVVEVVSGEGVQDAGGGSAPAPATPAATPAAPPATDGKSRSVTFRYQPVISGVGEVFVAGSFNDWNVGATPMSDADGDGTWEATLLLAPGEYQYKFVVDGNWITDDKADRFVDDGFGGQNSVLDVDSRFDAIEVEKGDGAFFLRDLDVQLDYATLNEATPGELVFSTRSYVGDVQRATLLLQEEGGEAREIAMDPALRDAMFTTWRATVRQEEAGTPLRFSFRYDDGNASRWAVAGGGFAEERPELEQWLAYSHDALPPFRIPQWAQEATYYQIFPDRFANGDPSNDPDFAEPYYDGRRELPASGRTNEEYFHFVEDWDDLAGLQRSPYRTDGKPDYFSFYGGDIRGVIDHLDHLEQLGATVIYFNPVTEGRSNHRYDPCDYTALDPHLGTPEEFRELTDKGKERGIRVIVDMAYNHTGDCHFAFQDVVANGRGSQYWDWYEFKRPPQPWPLPAGSNALDYYDCWWGFGLHPNLNFDLSRPNAQEMAAASIEDAEPNWEVVNHLLDSAGFWLGDMGASGFRLDVPNEVPHWFWDLFRQKCREVEPDHVLIGEIWGDAGSWIRPDVFDAVMNYKYFKEPVVKWLGQRQGDAAAFDAELAPGRTRYPVQAVRAQMNLIDSHDTVRFLDIAGGDARRLRLAATFAMAYVGSPHIYYGDEVALAGGKDPDSRRTMPWDQLDQPQRAATLSHYRQVGQLRRDHPVLRDGAFTTLLAKGDHYAFLREGEDGARILVVLNNGNTGADLVLPVGNAGIADGTSARYLLGTGEGTEVRRGALKLRVPAVSGIYLELAPGS